MKILFVALSLLLLPIVLSGNAHADGEALVSLATAKSEALHPSIVAYGTVAPDPDHLTTVAIPREGIITALFVRTGALVHVGDPIADIETAPGVEAAYQQTMSAVAFAEKDLAHTKSLYAQQLATKSQLAAAQKALADAKAQLQAQTRIGAGHKAEVLRASATGIVTTLAVSPGDRVQANTVLVTIATHDRLLLNLGLEPEDALQVPVGAKVWMHSPQSGHINFSGKVLAVNAMIDQKSRLVNAVVAIPREVADKLVLGMVLIGTVDLPAKTGIVVPHSALMTDKNGPYVYVVTRDITHRRNVDVSMETDDDAMIAKGIVAGDEVVIAGNAGLEDGTKIRTH